MFYKTRNLLLIMLSCALAFTVSHVKAQGLVSLSEEAMFDDELESGNELPSLEIPVNAETPAVKESAPAQLIAPNAPVSAPKAEPKTLPKETKTVPAPEADVYSSSLAGDSSESLFGSSDEEPAITDDLFAQMSALEKKTALLNLELRREKLQNEIEAVKNARRQALAQEQEKAEALKLKNLEFEKEQEKKVLLEQEKLRELDIKFETLRQEKVLNAYKNQMLEENQKWIAHNANFYKQIADLRKSKKDLTEDTKAKLEDLQKTPLAAKASHLAKIETYKKEIKDLQAQIGVLRNRIDVMEKEREEARRNPFADAEQQPAVEAPKIETADAVQGSNSVTDEPTETNLSKLYAVTEIRGQGGELIAKLINKNGIPFYVKKGTALQSGHSIGEITSTYVMAEKDGEKSYLYFAAGGILPTEMTGFEVNKTDGTADAAKGKQGPVAGRL